MKKARFKGDFAEAFSSFVVRWKWVFVAVFAALTIFCCVMITQTKVLYDLSSYMPEGSDTKNAMAVLKDDFDDKGMAYVMAADVSEEKARELASGIAEIPGISNVTFEPSLNYKNGNALFLVNFSDYDATKSTFDATEQIIDYIDGKGVTAYYTGQSAYSYFTRLETEESILKIGIILVVAILIMLIFTSKTFFELVLMILVFGVAVALNMGTNFLFNGISYVSNLIALVLQLALSIDYSVILLHRYMEERAAEDSKTAAVHALKKGLTEIFSSSLTTIVGLCALALMALPIGVEIGLSLAKSIAASLLSVIFLMPALLVIFDKPLMKSKHKFFVPNITKPAKAILKARKVIAPAFLIVVVLACTGQFYNKYSFNMNGAARIVNAQNKIDEAGFGTLNSLVVIVPKGDYQKERALANEVMQNPLVDSATALSTIDVGGGGTFVEAMAVNMFDDYAESNPEKVDAVGKIALVDLLGYFYEMLDDESIKGLFGDSLDGYKAQLGQLIFAKSNLEGENYARLTFNMDTPIEGDEANSVIEYVKSVTANYYSESYMMGESMVCYEMENYFPRDNLFVSLFTVLFVFFILLLTFKNIALPVVLTLAIQGGVWLNFVIPFMSSSPVCFIGYLIICAVQMGATIDYAIVLTNRYYTTRSRYTDRLQAMAEAENAVFPTIITSGTILTVAGFTLSLAASGVVADIGSLLGIGALFSMIIVLFILPSLLLVTEKVADKTSFGALFGRKKNKSFIGGETEKTAEQSGTEVAAGYDAEQAEKEQEGKQA